MLSSWFNLSMLAAESQQVICLRLWKIASGGSDARAEASLMISEKIAAAQDAAGSLMMGASPDSVVSGYRSTVRSNYRRLSR